MASRLPHRFRRRLAAAFVVVAAISAGVVAVVTFLLAREYRWRNFTAANEREVRFALAVAPERLDAQSFTGLRLFYELRRRADLVAVQDGAVFSSSPTLDLADLPPAPSRSGPADGLLTLHDDVEGRSAKVIVTDAPGGARYHFVFWDQQVRDSLVTMAGAAAGGWLLTVLVAFAVGRVVAARTLRPVASAAGAAEAIAAGAFHTRLPAASRDEFGALAGSFNHMADQVQQLIDELHESAARERRFTADFAHELRTPLTGLSAAAAMLGEQLDDLPEDLRRPGAIVVTDVERLRALVLELLELSQLDRAAEAVRPEPLELADAVAAVVGSADLRRRAEIAVAIDGDILVLAEPMRLRRILGNLVDNAVVHGGGSVRITGRVVDGDVLIRVADDGPGIPAEDRARVFDRFFKSDASRADGGSGLGLSIAHQQALAQGGDLVLDADTGRGASFTLRLPAAEDEDSDTPLPAGTR